MPKRAREESLGYLLLCVVSSSFSLSMFGYGREEKEINGKGGGDLVL